MVVLSILRTSVAALRSSSSALLVVFVFFNLPRLICALSTDPIPSPAIDLSELGRVGVTGDFDALSQYQYQGQLESGPPVTNGSQSIRAQLPNGDFTTLVTANGNIDSLCVFIESDGHLAGLVAAGNFSSLGGIQGQGVGVFNATQNRVSPLSGMTGTASTVFCDMESDTFYIGGLFQGLSSRNALAWVATQGWTELPFQGFNGPVTSITKLSTGNILFGGSFTDFFNASNHIISGNFSYFPNASVPSNVSLHGHYEFYPKQYETTSSSMANNIGRIALSPNATVNQLISSNSETYVAGKFTGQDINNVFVLINKEVDGLSGGLDAEVRCMLLDEGTLYVGGNFASTNDVVPLSLNHFASYSTQNRTWHALGAGVNGPVTRLNTLLINITAGKPEIAIIINGDFNQILAFGNNKAIGTDGLGVWVPAYQNWLDNLHTAHPAFVGQLSTSTGTMGMISASNYFAGTIASYGSSANGVIFLAGPVIESIGLKLARSSSMNSTSISSGLFFQPDGVNVTVLGGQFAFQGQNDAVLYNLAFINGSNSDSISGVFSTVEKKDEVFALAAADSILYVGGKLSGHAQNQSINGFLLYNLVNGSFALVQPPPLLGDDVAVKAIEGKPGSTDIYIGGHFEGAGGIECSSVCIYKNSTSTWERPGTGLIGSTSFMTWTDKDTLILGGNFSIFSTPSLLVSYYAPDRVWTPFNINKPLNGAITAMSQTQPQEQQSTSWSSDSKTFWVAGKNRMAPYIS